MPPMPQTGSSIAPTMAFVMDADGHNDQLAVAAGSQDPSASSSTSMPCAYLRLSRNASASAGFEGHLNLTNAAAAALDFEDMG